MRKKNTSVLGQLIRSSCSSVSPRAWDARILHWVRVLQPAPGHAQGICAEPTLARSMKGKYIILELTAATFSFRISEIKQPHLCYVNEYYMGRWPQNTCTEPQMWGGRVCLQAGCRGCTNPRFFLGNESPWLQREWYWQRSHYRKALCQPATSPPPFFYISKVTKLQFSHHSL